jgi:hypothetical protein
MKKSIQWKDAKVKNFNPDPITPTPFILAQQTNDMSVDKPRKSFPSNQPNCYLQPHYTEYLNNPSNTTPANPTTKFLSKSLPTVSTTTKPFLQKKTLWCPTPST